MEGIVETVNLKASRIGAVSVLAVAASVGMLASGGWVVFGPAVSAQAPGPTDAQVFVQQLAQAQSKLGACNAELGPLQQLSAQVLTGELQSPAAMLPKVRAAFEAANPGSTLNTSTWKVEAKSAKVPPTTQ
jgi:hypothetical protein